MRSPLVRLGVGALVTLGVLAGVVLLVPSLRTLVLGERLAYNFKASPYPRVGVQAIVRHNQEVQGQSAEDLGLPEGEELRLELKEEIQPGTREQTVFYVCGEARTEADAARQVGRRLSGARLMARVLPQGGVVGAQAVDHKQEPFFQGSALRPLFNALWPPLPLGYLRPGSRWTATLRVEVEDATLTQPVVLEYRMEYSLERFISEAGIRAADLSWRGEIHPVAPAVGAGNVTGACLLGTDSGTCLNGGYNLLQTFEVPLPDLPADMRLAWKQEQAVRYYRLK